MSQPIETFADVLHTLVDTVLTGDLADKAHAVIDQASGQRTPAEADPEPEPEPEPVAAAPVEEPTPVADTQ